MTVHNVGEHVRAPAMLLTQEVPVGMLAEELGTLSGGDVHTRLSYSERGLTDVT